MAETNTELKGEDYSSRFQVLERPTVYPGQCACCGSVNRPVVDFGVEIDFEREGYGALLLCEHCCKQAASKFPADPNPNVVDRAYHEQALAEQKQILHDGLRRYLDAFDPSSVPVYGSADSVPEQTESADVTDVEPELQRESESASRSTVETDESVSSEGPVSVSSDSSDGTDDDPLGIFRGV